MNVHILATVLKHELIASTLLVFKTLRAGFPTATIHVAGNDLDHPCDIVLGRAAQAVGASYANIPRVAHGAWIEFLLRRESEPFWICDGDIEFYGCVEDWFKNPTERQLFAGRYEPEFFEEWTQSQHVARLHPSLMWFNPRPLRAAMRLWPGKHPFFHSVEKTLVRWAFVPDSGKLRFYDTCAGLHHALEGTPFTPAQNDAFHHTFAGTYSDLIGATDEDSHNHEALCKSALPVWPVGK